jgi:hypothetical protein
LTAANERIHYKAAKNSERWADPEEKVRAEFWAELIYKYVYHPDRIRIPVHSAQIRQGSCRARWTTEDAIPILQLINTCRIRSQQVLASIMFGFGKFPEIEAWVKKTFS